MNVQFKCCLTCFPSLEGLALFGLFILSQDLRFLKSTSTSKYWSVSNNLSSAVDRAVETFVTVLVPCQIQLQVGFSFSQSLPVGLGSICIFLLVDLTLLVCFLSMFKFSQKLLFQACSPPITSLTRILHVGLDYSWAWRRLSMSLLSSIFFLFCLFLVPECKMFGVEVLNCLCAFLQTSFLYSVSHLLQTKWMMVFI